MISPVADFLDSVSVSRSVVSDCDFADHNPPGSSEYEILQAGILEWTAISYTAYPAYNLKGIPESQSKTPA